MADDDHDADFGTGDSGASETFPVQCSALRKNGHVMLKGLPCKIVEMSTSKTGKHGHAKVHMIGLDIFSGKKLEDICPGSHNMQVPTVKRTDYQVLDIEDGFLSLMDDGGETRDDIKVPEGEVGDEIQKKIEEGESILVTVMSACGQEAAVACKPMGNK